ncbi:hypothetical protein JXA31_10175 [Candidatus Bathyarchaeota archaeon]|nr:hypothetical protein [Candidatus Bathyarchaeota archaeon]
MPQITIEYMIMIPMLILQIFLFPLTAGWIMTTWVDSRQTLALQETGSHLSSSIQQLYSALTHDSISTGTVRSRLAVSPFIEGYAYRGNASLRASGLNSSQFLDITLRFEGSQIGATTSVTLGSDVQWDPDSAFMSNSTNANLVAEKMANGTILMYFEGDE